MFKLISWIFSKCRDFFSSSLGKKLSVMLGILGLGAGTAGAAEAGKAIKLNRRSKKIRDDALKTHEEHYQNVQSALESTGKMKLSAIASFEEFANQMEKIQERPKFNSITCKGVALPIFTTKELKTISNNVTLAIESVAYTGTGAGLGIAVCGLNYLALGPGLFIGGIGLIAAGDHIKKKAIENNKQAMQLAKDVNIIIEQYDELANAAILLEKHISSVYSQYIKHLERMKIILSNKTAWDEMSKQERAIIENTILLVGLLFKLCKIELIINDKEAEVIATTEVKVIGKEVTAVLKHTRRLKTFA